MQSESKPGSVSRHAFTLLEPPGVISMVAIPAALPPPTAQGGSNQPV
jgi:hypothetical protein